MAPVVGETFQGSVVTKRINNTICKITYGVTDWITNMHALSIWISTKKTVNHYNDTKIKQNHIWLSPLKLPIITAVDNKFCEFFLIS